MFQPFWSLRPKFMQPARLPKVEEPADPRKTRYHKSIIASTHDKEFFTFEPELLLTGPEFRVQAAVQFGQAFIKGLSTNLRAVTVTGSDNDCAWLNPQTISALNNVFKLDVFCSGKTVTKFVLPSETVPVDCFGIRCQDALELGWHL